MQLILLNPNTSESTTQAMLKIAQEAANGGATVEGWTAGFGAPLILNEAALAIAAEAVFSLRDAIRQRNPAGVIVAAFGDPGQALLAAGLPCAVTGIAEAGMAEAAEGGRRFTVVTTTPDLVAAITRTAERYGHGALFLGVRLTPDDPRELMADSGRLEEALFRACEAAMHDDGAEAIVIGGGPLAVAARALNGQLPVPIIEPIPAAVKLAIRRAGQRKVQGR